MQSYAREKADRNKKKKRQTVRTFERRGFFFLAYPCTQRVSSKSTYSKKIIIIKIITAALGYVLKKESNSKLQKECDPY